MKPVEIKENIYWIGALHPDLRVFDIIMETKNGTTYNSYLIKDEKTVVIDTVKEKFADAYMQNLSQLVDPKDIDYIIIQHNEPDHSGSLLKLLDAAPNAQIICAGPAVKYVNNIVNREVNIRKVKQGETLELGSRTLTFIPAPFLHWPDTMMTYLESDKILFPCDVFATHYCDPHLFNDLIKYNFSPDYKYYFDCIMRPFKKNVRNMLEKISDLQIETIAPSHGPILRQDLDIFINAYAKWSEPAPENNPPKILMYYASAHGNTEIMANKIADGARNKGADVAVYDTTDLDPLTHLDQIENADALLFGSTTINNNVVKPVWDVLNSLVTLDLKGKIAGSFGSYGWSGEAVPQLDERLKTMKFKVPYEGVTAVLVPSDEELQNCYTFGEQIAGELF